MKKLLFITHEASRTGAPFVILFFLQWLKKYHSEFEISVLALKDGDLKEELVKTSHQYYSLAEYKQNGGNQLISRGLRKFGIIKPLKNKSALLTELASENFDIVYSNTIVSLPLGDKISKSNSNTKHIVHVHELNAIIRLISPNFKLLKAEVTHFIAASNLVKSNLVNNWSIPNSKVTRVYECAKINSNATKASIVKKVFRVGGSGTVHWRKGSDLFVQVARYIKTNYPDEEIEFTWVGGISTLEKVILEEDLRKLGLENNVTFVGQQKNPQKYFEEFDVFLMTSREDPFPLVCIELGMLGKPIICFEGATGSEEVIAKGGGIIVPYMSVEAMGDEVMKYKNNPDVLIKHGTINKTEFSKFTPEIICPKLFDVISLYL